VVAVEEAVGKLRAAVRARQELDPSVVLIGRTDARGVAGGTIDEAIARANAYLQAGADVAFVEGPTSVDEIRRVVNEVRGPVLYNQAGDSPRLSTEELRTLGVAIVVIPGATLRPAIFEMYRHADDLRQRGAIADVEFARQTGGHPLANLHKFAGMDQVRAWEQEFLPPSATGAYSGSHGYQPPVT
jgi:2-methylisocitrate lyase-like PEP mutase family enzyme